MDRKVISIVFILGILALALVGCSGQSQASNNITQEATDAIHKVSVKYGESNSQIIAITQTEAEVTKEPMYIVIIKGNYRNGELTATRLEFSVLANGEKVWALQALSENGQPIWGEMEYDVGI